MSWLVLQGLTDHCVQSLPDKVLGNCTILNGFSPSICKSGQVSEFHCGFAIQGLVDSYCGNGLIGVTVANKVQGLIRLREAGRVLVVCSFQAPAFHKWARRVHEHFCGARAPLDVQSQPCQLLTFSCSICTMSAIRLETLLARYTRLVSLT